MSYQGDDPNFLSDSRIIFCFVSGAQSDTEIVNEDRAAQLSDRGYTSDSEVYDQSQQQQPAVRTVPLAPVQEIDTASEQQQVVKSNRSDGEMEVSFG